LQIFIYYTLSHLILKQLTRYLGYYINTLCFSTDKLVNCKQ
jgi:hypothetical protein